MEPNFVMRCDATRAERESEASRPRGLRSWLFRSGFSLLDQGAFALGNFGVQIVLARELAAPAYGAFASTNAAFALLLTMQTALVIEPMLVLAAQRRDHEIE